MNEKILVTNYLDHQDLNKLHTGELLAIRIPNFYSQDLCDKISARMEESELYGRYANAPSIGRVGQAFFECLASDELVERYRNNAVDWIGQMRSYSSPYLSPIDKLRLTLDESWPGGAHLGVLEGNKMFVGLARVFGRGASAEAHQDILSWDAPESAIANSLKGQLAANIYLKMPSYGGELKIWPKKLSQSEYQFYRMENSYGINPEVLNCQAVTIQPEIGELIIFNCTYVHAVTPSNENRVTWSCFIGNRTATEPLMMWS
jgi:hypothetical protein